MKSKIFYVLFSLFGLTQVPAFTQGFTGLYDPSTWVVVPFSPGDQVLYFDQDSLVLNCSQEIFIGAQPFPSHICSNSLSFSWDLNAIDTSFLTVTISAGADVYDINSFTPGQFGPIPIAAGDGIGIQVQDMGVPFDAQLIITDFYVGVTDTTPPVFLLPADTNLVADSGSCCQMVDFTTGTPLPYYQHLYYPGTNLSFNANDETQSVSEIIYNQFSEDVIISQISVFEKVCYPLPSSIDVSFYLEPDINAIAYQTTIDSSDYSVELVDVTPANDSIYRFTFDLDDILFPSSTFSMRIAMQGNGAGCFHWVSDDMPSNDLNYFSTPGPLNTANWSAATAHTGEPLIEVFRTPITNLFVDDGCGVYTVVQTSGLPSGSCFLGTTINTFEATDYAGNVTTASFTVNVMSGQPATPIVNELETLLGLCGVLVTETPLAIDPCNGDTIIGTTLDSLSYTDPGIYTIHWTFDNGSAYTLIQEQTVLVALGDCIGIEEATNNKLVVYPNPSNGIFTINTDLLVSNSATIELINSLGQKVYGAPLQSNVQTLQLDYLDPGIYHLVIIDEQNQFNQTIIIQ